MPAPVSLTRIRARPAAVPLKREGHSSAGTVVFDGIRHQIHQHLIEALPVGVHAQIALARRDDMNGDTPFCRQRPD